MSDLRPPKPDWDRPGETWRVEREPNMERVFDGSCGHRDRGAHVVCGQEAVALVIRSGLPLCREHIATLGIWIEGEVVSWRLSR